MPESHVRRADVPRTLLVVEAVFVAVFVRGALRVMPLPRVVALLRGSPFRSRRADDVESCVAAASAAAARVAHPTCLYRALVAFALLARRGAPVVFHLGADRAPGFGAHAWLSIDGRPLDQDAGRWPELWQRAAAGPARS
jgi:hypothetical protein